MKLLRKREYPSGKFTLAFVGYSDETSNTVVELTYNWETHKYDLGNAFGRRALALRTFTKLAMTCAAGFAKVVREPEPMAHGGTRYRVYRRPKRLPD